MKRNLVSVLLVLVVSTKLSAQIEPNAGSWKTWFIASAKDYRLPTPASHKNEIAEVIAAQKKLDEAMMKKIVYWNAGSPTYRWHNLMANIWMDDALNNGMLANLLLNVASYDAIIAAWDSKYTHKRPRPFATDTRIRNHASIANSPSYPCEYSVSAGVAVAVISHFFPSLTDSVNRMAKELMNSRVAAGSAFPSDTKAGFELGKRIAEKEIEYTKGFLNNSAWDGKIPEGKEKWRGQFAMLANAGKSKTIVLTSGSQFRPGPPPDFAKDMGELKNYKHNFASKANAFFHASQSFWEGLLDKKIFEYNLHINPPRAARLYAITAIGFYDGFVACWDAKYAYWGIRPDQYDTTFKPLMASPPFPGYPSGHAAVSSVSAELYSYFFPSESHYFRDKAKEVAESRFQAGIHFRTDNEAALELGKKVAGAIIDKIKEDGADTKAMTGASAKKQ